MSGVGPEVLDARPAHDRHVRTSGGTAAGWTPAARTDSRRPMIAPRAGVGMMVTCPACMPSAWPSSTPRSPTAPDPGCGTG